MSGTEYQAIVKVVTDRVCGLLETLDLGLAREYDGRLIQVDGQMVELSFDYFPESAGRRFCINTTRTTRKGREGKFAYKDLTTEVNYDLIVKSILKEVEVEKENEKKNADWYVKSELVLEMNKEFGCSSTVYLNLRDDGEIELVVARVFTPEEARTILAGFDALGLLQYPTKSVSPPVVLKNDTEDSEVP